MPNAPKPTWQSPCGRATLYHGDCLEIMPSLPEASADAVVTDPPYGLGFMGAAWDHSVPGVPFWEAALRVAKPGAHLLAFGGTRTFHRLAVAIEDAGWELRDCVMWVYGTGFPKSHDVSKAIDKAAGAEREQWQGWGTALKPAWEPIIVARKPLDGTVAANVLAHGTGGINVDACRVEVDAADAKAWSGRAQAPSSVGMKNISSEVYGEGFKRNYAGPERGRWPANLIHDGSDEVVGLFPKQKSPGNYKSKTTSVPGQNGTMGKWPTKKERHYGHGDSGSAARFFYCAKASKADRDEGCEGLEEHNSQRLRLPAQESIDHDGRPHQTSGAERYRPRRNTHPTVKPTALMRYLCRLVTPPGGLILDPFMGSSSTGKGAGLEGFRFVGIELDPEDKGFLDIARARITHAIAQRTADMPVSQEASG